MQHREVLVGVALVAGAQPAEVVQVGEGALDDPALAAEAGTVGDATPSTYMSAITVGALHAAAGLAKVAGQPDKGAPAPRGRRDH